MWKSGEASGPRTALSAVLYLSFLPLSAKS
jgi:hypothetical protein